MRFKDLVLIGERVLLYTIAFKLDCKHPHSLLGAKMKELGLVDRDTGKRKNDGDKEIATSVWNFCNDSYNTQLMLQFSPEDIISGLILMTFRMYERAMPQVFVNGGFLHWREAWGLSVEDVDAIVTQMLDMYEAAPGDDAARIVRQIGRSSCAVDAPGAPSSDAAAPPSSLKRSREEAGTDGGDA